MTKFVAFVAGLVVATAVEGFALKTLWGWFVVPLFSVPVLLWAQAIGLALTAKVFTGSMSIATDLNAMHEAAGLKRDHGEEILRAAILPLVALGLGWVYRLFM